MIFVRGDTHGEESQFTEQAMPGENSWTAEDILLIAGDFGCVFQGEDRYLSEHNKLNALAKKPYRILFVDGNHEGFPFLKAYPEEIQYGAPVRKIRDNIFWLQRGYIYDIEGQSVFVMGGAHSMDKAFRMKYFEVCGEKIWFEEELPSNEEYQRAIANLREHNMEVDYILTHTAPRTIIPRLIHAAPDMTDAELTGFLDWVYHEVKFKKWYFGHFHEDIEINEQMIACYTKVRQFI